MGQQRVALRRQQRCLGTGFFAGRHVAEQLRVAARAEPGQQFAAAALLRRKRLLVDRGLEDDGSFLEEDLWQLRRVGDVVKPPGALVGDLDHGLRPGMARDEHGADSDLVGAHAVHQLFAWPTRVAVAKDDHVLDAGGRFLEPLVAHRHQVFERRQVALVHAHDLPAEFLLVADLAQVRLGEQPAILSIPQHDSQFIVGAHRVQHTDRALPGDLISIVELHAMHQQHQRARRQHLLAVEFHAHRQRPLERGVAVAACGK